MEGVRFNIAHYFKYVVELFKSSDSTDRTEGVLLQTFLLEGKTRISVCLLTRLVPTTSVSCLIFYNFISFGRRHFDGTPTVKPLITIYT